ncbi:MAG: VOC family protein [Kofleriaceae bacterium]
MGEVGESRARLRAVHPVLACHSVAESLQFYRSLHFEISYQDDPNRPTYAVARRDDVEVHLQWADEGQWVDGLDRPAFRFVVDDVDGLHAELAAAVDAAAFGNGPWRAPADTTWGTREFHVRDPGGNVLQFYRELST